MEMRMRVVAEYLFLLLLFVHGVHGEETPAAILEHTRAEYAALTSYSDKGTVLKEYGTSSHDEFTFETMFTRAPRHFLFDYHKPSGDRMVVWGDPDAFHVWWKATGQVSEYPNPKNTGALLLSDFPTDGAISKIAPLLYSKAGLPGAIAHFEPARIAGTEVVAGSKCYRLEGTASDTYGETGQKVNVRTITVWIDAGTFLARKVVEEAPAAPGMMNRTTTTFTPQANPKLSEDPFRFAPPR